MITIVDKFNVISGYQTLHVYLNDRLYTSISPGEKTKTINQRIAPGSKLKVQKGKFVSNAVEIESPEKPLTLEVAYLLPNFFGIFAYLCFFGSMALLWLRYDGINAGPALLTPMLVLVYFKIFRKNNILQLLPLP